MTRIEKLIAGINLQAAIGVEIGALCNPILRKGDANVLYVDYADADTLRQHYAGNPLVDPAKIVETDAIWGEKTLKEALGKEVDFVVASHVIEHVPDLITWLGELHSVLSPSGEIRLAIPDRRFTFDFLRRETEIAEVLSAHLVRARVPQPYFLLDYYLNATQVDAYSAWRGEVRSETLQRPDNLETVLAWARDVAQNGTYRDAHCWVFTPRSFARLFEQLGRAGLIQLACERFHDTEENTIEFFVALKASDDRTLVAESWRSMSEAARVDVPGSFEALQVKHDAALSELQEELTTARAMQEKLLSDHNRLLFERDRLVGEQERLSADHEQLKAAAASAEQRLSLLERSRSWKITRPLRAVSTALRGSQNG
jgi:SAM-dependent methyltransferase